MEERKGTVYKITSPNLKIYIGATIRPVKNRWKEYRGEKCSSQPKIYNSIKKYGFDLHIFEVIEECVLSSMSDVETHWKKFYLDEVKGDWSKVLFCRLDDSIITEETLKKLHEGSLGENNHFYGKKHSEETKEKLRQISTGKKHSDETKKKMSGRKGEKSYLYGKKAELHPCFGKKQSEETIKKKSESRKNKDIKMSKEMLDKFSYKIIIDEVEYTSVSEASRQLNLCSATIINRLKNINFPEYQYTEEAKEKMIEKGKETVFKPKDIRIEVLIEGIMYPSVAEAARQLNLKHSTLVNRIESENFPEYQLLKEDKINKDNRVRTPLIIDDITYVSLKDASLKLKINQSTIRVRVKSKNFPNYRKA